MKHLLRALTAIGPIVINIFLGRKSKKTEETTTEEEK
jgi:hypothetical protein